MRNFGISKETGGTGPGGLKADPALIAPDTTRHDNVIQFDGSRTPPVAQRGGRLFSESQPASLLPFRESDDAHTRSRLTSHAPIPFSRPCTPPATAQLERRLTAAAPLSSDDEPSFICEFAAACFVVLFINIPGLLLLAAAVLFYALMVA